MIKFKYEGLDETRKKLEELANGDYIKKPVQRGAELIKASLTEYPPYGGGIATTNGLSMLKQKPGSKYKRTGRLASGWVYRTRPYSRSWAALFENNVPYADKVQGKGTQLPVHQGFWRTAEESVQLILAQITVETEKIVILEVSGF